MKAGLLLGFGLLALEIGSIPVCGQIIYPNDDVFVETSTDGLTTTTCGGKVTISRIVFGRVGRGLISIRRRI